MASDTKTGIDTVTLGVNAGTLLANSAFREAALRLDAKYVALWRQATNSEQRDAQWVRQSVLAEVLNELQTLMNSGQMDAKLAEQQKKS